MSTIPPSSMPQIALRSQLTSSTELDVGIEVKVDATVAPNQLVQQKSYAEFAAQAGSSMIHYSRIPEKEEGLPSTPKKGTIIMGINCSPTNIAGTTGRAERAAKLKALVAIGLAKRDKEITLMRSLRKSPPSYLKYSPGMWTPPKAVIRSSPGDTPTQLNQSHALIAFEQHHAEDLAQFDKHYHQVLRLEKEVLGEVKMKGGTPEKSSPKMVPAEDQMAAPIAALAPARPSTALVLRGARPLIRSISTSAARVPAASVKGTIQGSRLARPKSVGRSFSDPASGPTTTTTTTIVQPVIGRGRLGPKEKTTPTLDPSRPRPIAIPKAPITTPKYASTCISKIGRVGIGIKAPTPPILTRTWAGPAPIPKAATTMRTGALNAPAKTGLLRPGAAPRPSLSHAATITVSKRTPPGSCPAITTLKKSVSATVKRSITPPIRPAKALPKATARKSQAIASSTGRKPLAPVKSNFVPPILSTVTQKKAAGPSKVTLPARPGNRAATKLAPVRPAGAPAPTQQQVTTRSIAAPPNSTTALAAKKCPPGVVRPVRSAPPAPKPVIKVTRPTPQIVTRIVSAPSTGPSEEEDEGLTVPGASRRVRTLKRISKAVEYELEDDCEEVEKEVEEPGHGASAPSTDPVTALSVAASEPVSIPEAAPVHHRQPVHPAISDDQLMAQVYRHTKRLKAKYAENNPGSGRSGYLKYLHEVKTKWKNARQAEIEELKGVVSRYGPLLADTALASGFGNGEPMRAYWLARKMEALVALSGVSLKTRQEAHPSADYAAGIFCTMAKRDIKKKFEVVLWMQFVAEHPNATMEDFQSFLFVCSL